MKRYKLGLLALCITGTCTIVSANSLPDVVVDKVNHIYWQDNQESMESSEDWDDAVSYCSNLVLDGMKEWRLPTFQELLSIVDFGRVHPAINKAFEYTNDDTYWSATEFALTSARAWIIDFRTGESFYSYTSTNHTVRCVKDMPTATKEKK